MNLRKQSIAFLMILAIPAFAADDCDVTSPIAIGDCKVQQLVDLYSRTGAPDPWMIEAFARRRAIADKKALDHFEKTTFAQIEQRGDKQTESRRNVQQLVQEQGQKATRGMTALAQSPAMPVEAPVADDRVHAASQNFATPWAIALSSVEKSDDGQSLFIRRNGMASVTVGLHNVENPFPVLVKSVADDEQEALGKKLKTHLNDFDDWSVSVGSDYKNHCNRTDLNAGGWCFGREPDLYSEVLSEAIAETLADQLKSTDNSFFALVDASRIVDIEKSLRDLTREEAFDLAHALRTAQRAADEQREIEAGKTDYSKLLAALIANQPQASFSATYRQRDPLVGRSEWSAQIEFGTGFDNVSSRLRDCGEQGPCDRLLKDQHGTNRLTASIGYTSLREYKLEVIPSDVTLGDLEPLEDAKMWVASLLWSRDLGIPTLTTDERSANFSLEGSFRWLDADPTRPQERTVVSATLTLPVGKDMNLPITLRYANEPEFLGEANKQIGMHFGISYKLPFGKGK